MPARCPGRSSVSVAGSPSSHRPLDRVGRLAERRRRPRLKTEVTAGNWPWWLIDEIPHRYCRRVARRSTAAPRRRSSATSDRACRASPDRPAAGRDLEDHVIAVELGEILRDLALAERVVERVVDHLRLDAEPRRGVAVDRQRHRGGVGLLVGRDVAQLAAASASSPASSAPTRSVRPDWRPAACIGTASASPRPPTSMSCEACMNSRRPPPWRSSGAGGR